MAIGQNWSSSFFKVINMYFAGTVAAARDASFQGKNINLFLFLSKLKVRKFEMEFSFNLFKIRIRKG